jgi:hypothetical protein
MASTRTFRYFMKNTAGFTGSSRPKGFGSTGSRTLEKHSKFSLKKYSMITVHEGTSIARLRIKVVNQADQEMAMPEIRTKMVKMVFDLLTIKALYPSIDDQDEKVIAMYDVGGDNWLVYEDLKELEEVWVAASRQFHSRDFPA